MSDARKEQLIRRLTRARAALHELLDELDAAGAWATPVYSDGEMGSALDVLNHLVDAEWGITRNAQNIVAGGEGVPADFDRDRYNDSRLRKSRGRTPADIRPLLESNRAALLAFIEGLADDELDRQGRHAMLEIMSVEQHLKIIGLHELGHVRDIRAALETAT